MSEPKDPVSVADLLQTVLWDYDPDDETTSPLMSTDRFFRDFPWEPEEVFVVGEGSSGGGGE
jgi:hypothetical protein